jgi:hypothetical protein
MTKPGHSLRHKRGNCWRGGNLGNKITDLGWGKIGYLVGVSVGGDTWHAWREGEGGRRKDAGEKVIKKRSCSCSNIDAPPLPPGKIIKRPARVLVLKRAGP